MADTASRRPPLRRPLGWLALIGLVALAVAGGWWAFGARESEARYRTARVERGSITAVVSSSGTLNAVTTVQVGSQVSGQVKEIYVDFNSPVEKGQLIARLDPSSFELRVKQAQAEVEAARTQLLNQRSNVLVLRTQVTRARITLDEAASDHRRKQSLYEKGFISIAELEKAAYGRDAAAEAMRTAEAQVAVGEAQVANAEAVLRQREIALAAARVDLERTAIRAPVEGVVISRNVDAGQTVAASLQAPTLFTIAQDLREMQVDTAIDESDIGRIRVEQPAQFTVDAFPGRTFRGSVRQIRKAAQTVQNVVTYTVVIGAANPELTLVPGMTANVRIVTDRRDNVLKVPNAALRFRPPGVRPAPLGVGGRLPEGSPDSGRAGPAHRPAGGAENMASPSGRPPGIRPAMTAVAAAADAADPETPVRRLVDELALDAGQQARLEDILAGMRERFKELGEVPEGDRRLRAERLRADARQQIAGMLRPEQQKRYTAIVAQQTGRFGASSGIGRVWIEVGGGAPRDIVVRTGLTDGTSTELLGSPLVEGSEVIVGNLGTGGGGARPGSSTTPAPRLPF